MPGRMTSEYSEMLQFVADRNNALIRAVMQNDLKPLRAYCKKYKIEMPKERKIVLAGIYKAAFACEGIPEEVKDVAFVKCLRLGFNPMIKPIEAEGKDNGESN